MTDKEQLLRKLFESALPREEQTGTCISVYFTPDEYVVAFEGFKAGYAKGAEDMRGLDTVSDADAMELALKANGDDYIMRGELKYCFRLNELKELIRLAAIRAKETT